MLRIKDCFTALALITLFLSGGTCPATEFECSILQYKLGRIYLGAGEEQNVYPGCRFMIFKDNDTLYSGQIEYSYLGVSLSRPTFGLSDTAGLQNYRASLEPATTDSSSSIELGCYGLHPMELIERINDRTQVDSTGLSIAAGTTTNGNPVVVSQGDAYGLTWDYESGRYNGFFSSSIFPESMRHGTEVISTPAPFFAALIPNLSKKANQQGFVTTSLYYRFDVGMLWPGFFQSEIPTPVNRLYVVGTPSPRVYTYDADKGRTLLTKHRHRPEKVSIGFLNPKLEQVARFFADVLARDRIKVEVKAGDVQADLLVSFIPIYCDEPFLSLSFIHRILTANEPATLAVRETLDIVGGYLMSARDAADVASRFHFCRLADRTLQNDLGVFPLFRPTVYFLPGKNLKNVRFDKSGYLDIASLTKITLPVPESEPGP